MASDTRSRLVRCFAAVFPELTEVEIDRASLTSVASWDSVATVTLLLLLEEEFGIELSAVNAENLVSFEMILEYVQR